MVRLAVVLGSALLAVCALSIGSAPAAAATVLVTGSGDAAKIVITYDTNTTEHVSIGTTNADWTITGDFAGSPLTIPMTTSCYIEASAGTGVDSLSFAPSTPVTSTRCTATPFGLVTAAYDGSQTLAGTVQMSSALRNIVSLHGAVILSGPTTFDLNSGGESSITLRSPVDGARALTLVAESVRLLEATIGSQTPPTSVSITTGGRGNLDLDIARGFSVAGPVMITGRVNVCDVPISAASLTIVGDVTGSGFQQCTLNINVTDASSVTGAIRNGIGGATLGVEKRGTGDLTLTGESTFTGGLSVTAGDLVVSGTLTPSSTTVASGATITGAGTATIVSPLAFAGSSGFGIGTGNPYKLTVGTITSTTSAPFLNVVVDRTTTPGTDYTQIVSTGSADLRGLDFWTNGFIAPLGTTITPIRTASGFTAPPTNYPEGSYYDAWRISYAANGGRDMTWTFVGQVPVIVAVSPSTSTVAGGGLLTIMGAQFYDGTQVSVGGAECTNATRITNNTMTCTLPAHAAGAADVTVTNVSRSATLVGAITYEKPITPSTDTAGTPTGGTTTRTLTIGTPRVVGMKLVTTITAPGAGVIAQTAVTGTGRKATMRCRARQAVTTATDVTVTCALNARARAALSQSSMRLTITTTFTPTGGTATTRIAKVTASRAATGKRTLPA